MVLKFFSFLRSHSLRELSWAPEGPHQTLYGFNVQLQILLVQEQGPKWNLMLLWCMCNSLCNKCTSNTTPIWCKRLFGVLTCGQIVSILRESNGGHRTRVAREVCHIGALLEIPDLDLGISSASSKNETIRVKLSTGESCKSMKKHQHLMKYTLLRPSSKNKPNRLSPQPALSSVTFVRTLPVWISEKAQYCGIK